MKVYFVGQYIPSELMNQYFEQMKNLTDVAANNFYNALLNGFQENGEDVSCSSQVPENLLSVCNREKKNKYKFIIENMKRVH